MREVTESDERALGVHAFLCDRCKHECQTTDLYPDPPRRALPLAPPPALKRGGRGINRDPRLFGIVRRCQRYEARIASGKGGAWTYIGLFATIGEAIAARNEALLGQQEKKAS